MSPFIRPVFRRDLPAKPAGAGSRASGPGARLRLLAALAGYAALLPAHAGRPLATDDAGLVDPGACQVETWIARLRDGRGIWISPGCNPFGSTEFSLGGARLRDDGAADVTVQQWQVKQLLRSDEAGRMGFALAVGGQRVRGGDLRETFASGIATVPLGGEARLLHVNLGTLRQTDAGGRRKRAVWGLAYETRVADATHGALETFGSSGERANWQLGLRHELVPGRIQLDASVGSAIGRWSQTRVFTAGLVFVSSAFLR